MAKLTSPQLNEGQSKQAACEALVVINASYYVEFLAELRIINKKFDQDIVEARLNGDAVSFMQDIVIRKQTIAIARKKFLELIG